jgi:hypothetical protein
MGDNEIGVQPSHAAIVRAVRTPLNLFGLIFLVIEAILLVAASKASGFNLTLIIVGMVVALVMLVSIVAYVGIKRPNFFTGESEGLVPSSKIRHDVFVSSPMAGFMSAEEYKRDREGVLRIVASLRRKCKFDSVFYEGIDRESWGDFDVEDIAVQRDYQALSESKYFIMLYLAKVTSSVLVEAGWALALRKPSIYFVRNRDDLPYLLRNAEMAFPRVKVYEVQDVDRIIQLIDRHGEQVLNVPSHAQEQSI